MQKVFKWLAGILLLAGLVGGSYLIYRGYRGKTKPSPQQAEQNEKKKQILKQQIQEIEEAIKKKKIKFEQAKNGENVVWDTFDEKPKTPHFDRLDKETEELIKKRNQTWNDYTNLTDEVEEWYDKQEEKDNNLWERQKDGKWKILTAKLDRSPEVKARFDKFIRTFFQRFTEKKGIPLDKRVDWQGFGNFYIKDDDGYFGEMGHCAWEEVVHTQGEVVTNRDIRCRINLNQIYLLNNGKIGMDAFYPYNDKSRLKIDFDTLIETIAHEIAHASQNFQNIERGIIDKEILDINGNPIIVRSQCESSGYGERDPNNPIKLIKPKYPHLISEHARFTDEIYQMIINSPEYKEFEAWWKSG